MVKSKTDFIVGIITLLFCAVGFYSTSQIDEAGATDYLGAASFPLAIVCLLTLLAILQIKRGFSPAMEQYWPSPPVIQKTFTLVGLFLVYVVVLTMLHNVFRATSVDFLHQDAAYYIGSTLFLAASLAATGRRRPFEIFAVAILVPFFIVFFFRYFFDILLP